MISDRLSTCTLEGIIKGLSLLPFDRQKEPYRSSQGNIKYFNVVLKRPTPFYGVYLVA
jgi:hypothetical protein